MPNRRDWTTNGLDFLFLNNILFGININFVFIFYFFC